MPISGCIVEKQPTASRKRRVAHTSGWSRHLESDFWRRFLGKKNQNFSRRAREHSRTMGIDFSITQKERKGIACTVHFKVDSLQHARIEGQPALPWGPHTNSNHTVKKNQTHTAIRIINIKVAVTQVKRSHSRLRLGEDDHHAATGQWYIPEFEEGGAATFSPLIISPHHQ